MVSVTSLLAFTASAFENKKSRTPEYRRIFRQPGCLREILKVFRPILADGLVLSSISQYVFRAEKARCYVCTITMKTEKPDALPCGRASGCLREIKLPVSPRR
jgi:hypothetical protein